MKFHTQSLRCRCEVTSKNTGFKYSTLKIRFFLKKNLELNEQKFAHKIKDFLLLRPCWCMSVALAAGGAVLPLNASLCVEKNDLQVCVTDMMVLIPRK